MRRVVEVLTGADRGGPIWRVRWWWFNKRRLRPGQTVSIITSSGYLIARGAGNKATRRVMFSPWTGGVWDSVEDVDTPALD